MKLTSKKQAFVDACRAAGLASPAKRSDLVAVANSMGQKYAPAWIVQNTDLRHDRGWFIVPGLDDTGVVIDSPATAAAVDAAAERVAAATAPKGNRCPRGGTVRDSWDDRWCHQPRARSSQDLCVLGSS